MSLTGYYFNDVFSDLASLDRFFDGVFNSGQVCRNQAADTFTPR
jgi:hypothetical protein